MGFLRAWSRSALRVEIHLTPEIVTKPPGCTCDALINSANASLVGTKLPYFPMQDNQPPGLQSSQWGGMEAGSKMFYPVQVVDGHVTALGGSPLRNYLQALNEVSDGVRCPVGRAVLSPALGDLHRYYKVIAHAVAPSRSDVNWRSSLEGCYRDALEQLWFPKRHHSSDGWRHAVPARVVATPILGAGANLASAGEAAQVAATVLASIEPPPPPGTDGSSQWVVRFGLLEKDTAEELAAALDSVL